MKTPLLSLVVLSRFESKREVAAMRRYKKKFNGPVCLEQGDCLATQTMRVAESLESEYILFLPVDALLDSEWEIGVEEYLARFEPKYGGFRLKVLGKGIFFKTMNFLGNLRSKYFHFYFPDQGLLVHRRTFIELGGMDKESRIPFASYCQKARHQYPQNKAATFALPLRSSARKWQENGYVQVMVHHQRVMFQYWLREWLIHEFKHRWTFTQKIPHPPS